MFHGRMFGEQASVRDEHFQPTRSSLRSKEKSNEPAWLDGNPALDRPLFVQFCANNPDQLLESAQFVAPYCDAVDLNLGCPQGIAKSGHYGAFLQEDWDTIHALINKLHNELSVPVTAKMRILETKEKTLDYARMILAAGASILTVHGRRREQKGHNTGVADWRMIRDLRDNLGPKPVLFANGNILNHGDIDACLEATGADGVMSAEGNLSDPTIFASPPSDIGDREYWRGPDGTGGYRVDGVVRRYLDIIYRHILDQEPPQRPPLYLPGDAGVQAYYDTSALAVPEAEIRKRKRADPLGKSPNLRAMQGHLFHMLKHIVPIHTDIRDALAKAKPGNMPAFEKVLRMLEKAVKEALDEEATKEALDEEATKEALDEEVTNGPSAQQRTVEEGSPTDQTIVKYKRPWWVCQPYLRPLPEAALEKGALQLSKKEKARLKAEQRPQQIETITRDDGLQGSDKENEITKDALVCG